MHDSQRKKAELEADKLSLEIRELRWAWARYVATLGLTFITVLVAYGTWWSQHNNDLNQREKDFRVVTDSRRLLLEDRYYKARDALSAPNVVLRMNAAFDLGNFTRPLRGKDVGDATADNAVTALTNRFVIEDSSDVMRALATVLGNSPPSALPRVATVNRLAASEFARLYGEELTAEGLTDHSDGLDREIDRGLPAMLNGRNMTARCPQKFPARDVAVSNYGLYDQAKRQPAGPNKNTTAARLKSLRHDAAVLVGTGIALESLLKSNSGNLRDVNLAGVVLYQVDVSGVDFSRAVLSSALVCGRAAGASFAGTDLRNSDIASVDLSGATFRNARLEETYLPDLRVRDIRGVLWSQADFAGSDWQKSRMYLPPGSGGRMYLHPWWLKEVLAAKRVRPPSANRP